jgi:CRISPR type III-A-associated RAMP protein Csm5
MRTVQVSDSTPISIEQFTVGLIWTYTLRGNRLVEKVEQGSEYKAFAEWLLPGATLRLGIRTDEFLFTEQASRDLRFRGAKEHAVRQLAQTCNAYARAIVATEKTFYKAHELGVLRDFYNELETTLDNLPDGEFLLCIGWGTGWEIKTVGDLLRTSLSVDDFKQLRQRYRLGEDPETHQVDLNAPLSSHTSYCL